MSLDVALVCGNDISGCVQLGSLKCKVAVGCGKVCLVISLIFATKKTLAISLA